MANDGRIACEDETNLVPIVQWDVTSLDNAQNLTELNNFTFLADISSVPFHGFDRWELTNTPLFLNYSNPSILNITGTLADPNYAAIDCTSSPPFPRSSPSTAVVSFIISTDSS